MATNANKTQGTVVKIGQGDAASVAPGADTFVTIAEVVGIDGPGGSADVIDCTSLQSTFKDKIMGVPDEGQVTLRCNLIFDDSGMLEAREARGLSQKRNIRITANSTQTGKQMDFAGFVLAMNPSASPNSKWDMTITVEITGAVTWS